MKNIYDPLVLRVCVFSLLKIKLRINFNSTRNMQYASSVLYNWVTFQLSDLAISKTSFESFQEQFHSKNPILVILWQNLGWKIYMMQLSLEFVVQAFWRANLCKTLLASGICEFYRYFSEIGLRCKLTFWKIWESSFRRFWERFQPKCPNFAIFWLNLNTKIYMTQSSLKFVIYAFWRSN